MATCTWPAHQRSAEVRVRLLADGTARASCATQDIGTGTYTIFAEIVSDKTGIPLDKIKLVLGDSSLPPGPTSGGSSATATVIPAIVKATENAVQAVLKAAAKTPGSPFEKADPKSLKMTAGRVHDAEQVARKRRAVPADSRRRQSWWGWTATPKPTARPNRKNIPPILSARISAKSRSIRRSCACASPAGSR